MPESSKKQKRGPATDGADEAAEQFRALGDPTRLRIVRYLLCRREQAREAEGAAAVFNATDISRAVTGSEKLSSTFSHHLKELRHAGILSVEKDGQNRRYQLVPGSLEALSLFLSGSPPEAFGEAASEK